MSAGVHKVYREDSQPFTMVPNDVVRNPEITPNAFRLLAYLMSHQDGYSLTYGQIERQTTLKRYAINAAIKLLTEHGYLEVRRTKLANGHFGPKDWIIKNPTTVDDSTVEPSHMESFHSGTADGHKKNTPRENQSIEKTNLEDAQFDQFWEIYPLKKDKRPARRAFESALKRVDFQTLLNAAQSYRDDPNRREGFTKYPATWLNADAWENGPEVARGKPTPLQVGTELHRKYKQQEDAGLDFLPNMKGIEE